MSPVRIVAGAALALAVATLGGCASLTIDGSLGGTATPFGGTPTPLPTAGPTPTPGSGSGSLVQHGTGSPPAVSSGAASTTINFPNAVQAGDLLVVAADSTDIGSPLMISVSDDRGDHFVVPIDAGNGGNGSSIIAYVSSATGGAKSINVYANSGASGHIWAVAAEFSPRSSGNMSVSSASGSSSAPGTSFNNLSAGRLVFSAAFFAGTPGTAVAANGYTLLDAPGLWLADEFAIDTSGSPSPSFTITPSESWEVVAAVF